MSARFFNVLYWAFKVPGIQYCTILKSERLLSAIHSSAVLHNSDTGMAEYAMNSHCTVTRSAGCKIGGLLTEAVCI